MKIYGAHVRRHAVDAALIFLSSNKTRRVGRRIYPRRAAIPSLFYIPDELSSGSERVDKKSVMHVLLRSFSPQLRARCRLGFANLGMGASPRIEETFRGNDTISTPDTAIREGPHASCRAFVKSYDRIYITVIYKQFTTPAPHRPAAGPTCIPFPLPLPLIKARGPAPFSAETEIGPASEARPISRT